MGCHNILKILYFAIAVSLLSACILGPDAENSDDSSVNTGNVITRSELDGDALEPLIDNGTQANLDNQDFLLVAEMEEVTFAEDDVMRDSQSMEDAQFETRFNVVPDNVQVEIETFVMPLLINSDKDMASQVREITTDVIEQKKIPSIIDEVQSSDLIAESVLKIDEQISVKQSDSVIGTFDSSILETVSNSNRAEATQQPSQLSNSLLEENINPTRSYTWNRNSNLDKLDSGVQGTAIKDLATIAENTLSEITNVLPVAINDEFFIKEDEVLTAVNLLANDSDADGDALSILRFTQATSGKVERSLDGLFSYTPMHDFHGKDEFTYTLTDGNASEVTASVIVWIESVNDLMAVNDELRVKEDQKLTNIDLLANDIDSEGGGLVISSFSQGMNGGQIFINGNGLLNYTPAPDFFGIDEFSYTVMDDGGGTSTAKVVVSVAAVNDVPNAISDNIIVPQTDVSQLMLLNNDMNIGDGVSLSFVSSPSHGVILVTETGEVDYQPDEGYFGKDEFIYKLTDIDGDVSIATVSLTVECVSQCDQVFVLSWNPSPTKDVSGYKLYVGFAPGNYAEVLEIGDVTEYEYLATAKGDYFFAISSLKGDGEESALSGQASATF